MHHLKLYNEFNSVSEDFKISINDENRDRILSEWGISLEEIEDIFLEVSDLGTCSIRLTALKNKVRHIKNGEVRTKEILEMVVTSVLNGIDMDTYDSITNKIIRRLSNYNIHAVNDKDENRYKIHMKLTHKDDLELKKLEDELLMNGFKRYVKTSRRL